jgi:hypothetical protein
MPIGKAAGNIAGPVEPGGPALGRNWQLSCGTHEMRLKRERPDGKGFGDPSRLKLAKTPPFWKWIVFSLLVLGRPDVPMTGAFPISASQRDDNQTQATHGDERLHRDPWGP